MTCLNKSTKTNHWEEKVTKRHQNSACEFADLVKDWFNQFDYLCVFWPFVAALVWGGFSFMPSPAALPGSQSFPLRREPPIVNPAINRKAKRNNIEPAFG